MRAALLLTVILSAVLPWITEGCFCNLPNVIKGHMNKHETRYGGEVTWDLEKNIYVTEEHWLGERNSINFLDLNNDTMTYENIFRGVCDVESPIPSVYRNLPTKCVPDSLTSEDGHLVFTIDKDNQNQTVCDVSSLTISDKSTYFHYKYYNFTVVDPGTDFIADIKKEMEHCDFDVIG